MPSASGPRIYESHIPSFMSVYDMDPKVMESPGSDPPTKLSNSVFLSQQHAAHNQPQGRDSETQRSQAHSHQHRESTSTQTSDSTDSSPTTTISTVDSSSLSDPSPSSSPESPNTLVPLSSFPGSSFGLDSFQLLKMADPPPIRAPFSDERPMTSPSPRKPKNPKSLALNLNSSVETFESTEVSSPSFIKPPQLKGRKKPSLLSLNTGAANKLTLATEPVASPRMPTMLQRRGLKHSISTPQMLATPGFGPVGGMTFGDGNPPKLFGAARLKESNLVMDTFTINEDADQDGRSGVQMATRVPGASVGGDTFDRPNTGEDSKPQSYPDGPILMHEPSVHLYLEPKLEEAMKFDVVINVAREVKNPFKDMPVEEDQKEATAPVASDSFPTRPASQIFTPDTAASMMSFRTAFEFQPSGSTESSPTTPKPTVEKKLPEYIHIPWDHNTDVKDELWDLCQTIESRVKEGKKVLVHCQQGASRSATLIIAYGMYTNQDLSANEAYVMAQSKSRWVNPNMSLLFSLNDFKKVIERKKAEKISAAKKPSIKHRPSLSADVSETPPSTPGRARGNSTPSVSGWDKPLKEVEDNQPKASLSETTIQRFADFDFGFGEKFTSKEPQQSIAPSHDTLPSLEKSCPEQAFIVQASPNQLEPFLEQLQPSIEKLQPSVEQLQPSVEQLQPSVEKLQPSVEKLQPTIEYRPSHFHFFEPAHPIERYQPDDDWSDALMSPRLTEMTANPIQSFSRSYSAEAEAEKEVEAPPTPTLFSPRIFEFPRSSFFPEPATRTSLAVDEDPRSPPTKGEAPIIRSIDDFL